MAKFGLCLLLGVVVLLAIIQEGTSLKCYYCSSPIGGVCGTLDWVNTKRIGTKKCSTNEKFCGTLEVRQRGNFTISRSCFRSANCDVNFGNRTCNTCRSNKCNSSAGLIPSFLVGIFASCFVLFFPALVTSA